MSRWDSLLDLQEHDTNLDQLHHRRGHLPLRGELDGIMGELARLEVTTAEVDERRLELARQQKRLEDEIATLNEKAARDDKALYSGAVANPRELQSLQDEIAALKRRISHLEDQDLELMEQIEPLDAEIASSTQTQQELDQRASAMRAEIVEEEVAIDAALERVAGERAAIADGVEPELLAEYDELRPRSGGIAIARLVGSSCGGCHLALSAVEIDRIKRLPPDVPVHCEECGRLLAR